jgi:hypothetical protein
MELDQNIDRYNQDQCVDEHSMLGMMKIGPKMAELCTFIPNAVPTLSTAGKG